MEFKKGDHVVYFPSASAVKAQKLGSISKRMLVEIAEDTREDRARAKVTFHDGYTCAVAKINLEPVQNHPDLLDGIR